MSDEQAGGQADGQAQGRKVALLTGAYGGVGTATARRLAKAGWRLALLGRRADALAALAAEVGALAADSGERGDDDAPLTLVADATSAEAVNAAVAQVVERWGRLDGAAHAVGSLLLKPGHLTTDGDWDAVIATNLTSAFYLTRAALKQMTRQQGGGSIVLISSVAAVAGLANHEGIAAAKGGVAALATSAAASYAGKGIRVNNVAPGLVRTQLTRRLTESEAALRASLALHPLGRVGEPDDVAGVVAWLLSDDAAWVTGQTISLDGGMSTLRVPTRG